MLPRASIKAAPEDFVVDEVPLYEPAGRGDHLFVRFTKRLLTTDEAVRAIGSAVGARLRDIGIAGLKDKVGVTTQTISIPIPPGAGAAEALADRVRALTLPGITIVDARAHGNKLKTGHLAGNRFSIRLSGLDPIRVGEVTAALERMGREGLPNAFGSQRFGRGGDNAERAKHWLSGQGQPPRDPRLRRLLWSALQSDVFNAVLSERVQDGTWRLPMLGDLVKLRTSGGLFLCADVQVDRARAERGEVCPTGPIVGIKMRPPEGEPARLEERVITQRLGETFDLAATKALGEGTRRALCLWIDEVRYDPPIVEPAPSIGASAAPSSVEQVASIRVYFVLPKGAYATTVLGSAVDLQTVSPPGSRGDSVADPSAEPPPEPDSETSQD